MDEVQGQAVGNLAWCRGIFEAHLALMWVEAFLTPLYNFSNSGPARPVLSVRN